MSAVLKPRPMALMPMRQQDIDAVVAAENLIYPFPWTRGNFVDSLMSGYSAWVGREGGPDGPLIGYAVLMVVLDEAHLLNLSIIPERQRQGLGSVLLEHLMEVARNSGATRMFLEVRPSNASGLALYGRRGFTRIGRRRAYYPAAGGREDAIVMARDL